MRDIARKLDISQSTVSYALGDRWREKGISPQTRQNVIKAASQLNYRRNRLATGLKTRKTMTVGVLVPLLSGDMYAQMVQGIEAVLGDSYTLVLGVSNYNPDKERRIIESFEEQRVDGLIVAHSGSPQNVDFLRRVHANNPCMVQVDRFYDEVQADIVEADNIALGRAATEHLLAQGHRKIAYVRSAYNTSASLNRAFGYEQAMRQAGLDPLFYPMERGVDASGRENWSYVQTRGILAMDQRPTALVAHTTEVAVDAIRAIEDCCLECPRDISICSIGCLGNPRHDDFLLRVRLASVNWSVTEMGRQAARFLLDRMDRPEECCAARRTVQIAGQLIHGNSVAALPASRQ